MQTKPAGWIFFVAGVFFALGWSLQRWSVESAAPAAPRAETVSDPWAGSIDLSASSVSYPFRGLTSFDPGHPESNGIITPILANLTAQ